MSEWCRGVNLAHVEWVERTDKKAEQPDAIVYNLIGARGVVISKIELDPEEYTYFFPRALVPAPQGTEVLRLMIETDGKITRHIETVVALALDDESFTEGAVPICADGLAFLKSTDEEMLLWRFPGGAWHEPGGSTMFYMIEHAEKEFRRRLAKLFDADGRRLKET